MIGAVRTWERQGLEGDPRRDNYLKLQQTELADLLEFQAEHVKAAKLISIVGDLSIIDADDKAIRLSAATAGRGFVCQLAYNGNRSGS